MWRRFVVLSICSTALVQGQPATASCPAFRPETTIAKINPADRIFRFDGGFIAVVNELRIDTDGSPVAYHPQNKGTTHLCNGLDPIINGQRILDKSNASPCFGVVRTAILAGWKRASSPTFCVYGFFAQGTSDPRFRGCNLWGGTAGRGEIALQGERDPAPGFFVSTTATTNLAAAAEDEQARYLDADRIPYAVIPGDLVRRSILRKGGIAWAWNPQSDLTAAGVFGDTQNKFGEISVAFAQKLEKGASTPITPDALTGRGVVPWPYGRKPSGDVRLKNSPAGPVVFVYFSALPNPALPNFEASTIEMAARLSADKLGGAEVLKECLRPLLRRR
jgi:hypothetical protein